MADQDVKALLLQVDASVELLRKNLTAGEQAVARFTAGADRSLDKLDGRFAKVYAGFGRLGTSAQQAQAKIEASSGRIRESVRSLAGAFGLYFTGRELIALTDGFTRMQNSLKVAGLEGQNLQGVQDALFASAQRYGTSVESLAALYGRLSQGSKELGASQEDLLKFSNGVAAAIKVQGGTAESSSGAILQLTQALGGAVVRAEEFNSINEGARPILQAVANNIDRFGGSVAKLRAEVIEGKVTSQEFFQAFLKGADGLEKQASKATLTTAASLQVLNNALTVYFGEASKTSGASAALGEAIKSIADNLDVIIPAIAVLSTALGVGFVSSAIKARLATAGLGQALLGAFGGPVGLAITAIIVGLGYVAAESAKTRVEMAALIGTVDSARSSLEAAADRARAAGVNVGNAGAAAQGATGHFTGLGNAFAFAAQQAAALAKNAKLAELATIGARVRAAEQSNADLRKDQQVADKGNSILKYAPVIAAGDAIGSALGFERRGEKKRRDRAAQIADNNQIIALGKQQAAIVAATPDSAFDQPASPSGVTTKPKSGPKPKKPPKDRSAQNDARYQDELAGLGVDLQAAQADYSGDIEERLAAELKALDVRLESYKRQVAVDDTLDATKRASLIAAQDALVGQQRENAIQKANADKVQEKFELETAANRMAQDALEGALSLATGRAQELEIAKRILLLKQSQERAEQERLLAISKAGSVEELTAKAALERLPDKQAAERQSLDRQYESPMQRYKREVGDVGNNINDEVEQIQVDGLRSLNDGLVDAIMGAKSLGDVFKNVAKQIIADLIRVAIQQTIVNSLMGAIGGALGGLFGGGGGGGDIVMGGAFTKFAGARAAGGPVQGGKTYLVGEEGPELWTAPGNGSIIPNSDLKAMRNGSLRGPSLPSSAISGAGRGPSVTTIHVNVDAKDAVLTQTVKGWVQQGVAEAATRGAAGGAALATQRGISAQRRAIP